MQNWSKNVDFNDRGYLQPESLLELQEVIRSNQKLRARGTAHCFNEIANTSSFEYVVGGKKGEIEDAFPLQQTVNTLLERIAKDNVNFLGEISARYQIEKIFLQSS